MCGASRPWLPPSALCDGKSPWDGNQDATGWPCLDQIGRGGDNAPFNGTPPPFPQKSEPAYFWNNTDRRQLWGECR